MPVSLSEVIIIKIAFHSQINGVKVDGLGFVAARQHLDAARPVARLLVERRPRLAESKYTMAKQTDSKTLSPSWSLDTPDTNTAGSSDEDVKDDNFERKENDDDDDDDEDSQVHFGFY